MLRAPAAAEAERYDLIVVGGGVQGACLALEASLRGLRSLLLERSDYGSGTSANTLRILHGGLRYLQKVDLGRYRESVASRWWWTRWFPELVEPLACLMPLYDRGLHRRALLGPALALNDLLSPGRNADVRLDLHLGRGRLLALEEVLHAFPRTPREGLRGGGLWYDMSMQSPHRLVIEVLRWAWARGAVSLNYVSATEVIVDRKGVVGVRATDRVGGGALEFRAPVVIEACGPWLGRPLQVPGRRAQNAFVPSLAFNVLIDRPLDASAAVALRPTRPGAPVYFLRPYGQLTLAGTVHAPWRTSLGPDAFVPDEQVERFMEELASVVPEMGTGPEHVERVLAGLIPAAQPGSARTADRPLFVNHGASDGPTGFWSVAGVKFTTAPMVARRTLDAALPRSRGSPMAGDPPPTRRRLGPTRLTEMRESEPDKARAELRTLIEDESVVTLEDLILRRLDWSLESAAIRSGQPLEGLIDAMALKVSVVTDDERP